MPRHICQLFTHMWLAEIDEDGIIIKFVQGGEKWVFTMSKSLVSEKLILLPLRDARFSWHNLPKRGEIYQITTKLPNCHKIYQMAVKYSEWPNYKFLDTPKYTKIGIYGLKRNHLATLQLLIGAHRQFHFNFKFFCLDEVVQ
jgi:hypothetical protein